MTVVVAGYSFREVWLFDFEYNGTPGEVVHPVCLVAHELGSQRTVRLWIDGDQAEETPPYTVDEDTLFIAYYASAEMACHLALGWPLPKNVLDLYTEFRNETNGRSSNIGRGLLDALVWYGLVGIAQAEKDSMRDVILAGGPWDDTERQAILDYCESDVFALKHLLVEMDGGLDLPRALLRGRYMRAAACIEHHGIPIDQMTLDQLQDHWGDIQNDLVSAIDAEYCVYERMSFKESRFREYLARSEIAWPTTDSGRLALDDDTFRDMAKSDPQLAPLRELRASLSKMRLSGLKVGHDGRNRCLLSAFSSTTGRNQPSSTAFIFGPSVWLRGLIKPGPGYGLAYIDYSQQEFGIAAALSGDRLMLEAYESGDPYISFAKQAGAIPPEGTKATHGAIREQYKACVLAVQYGMGPDSLAIRIGQPSYRARELLSMHRKTYPTFWTWSDACLDYANFYGNLKTVFGWTNHVGSDANPRSLRNFPMQANGAEMLRLACCFMVEEGIKVCAPVHDAVLIEAPLSELDAQVLRAQELMAGASSVVLDGFRLRTDAKIVRYPDRYEDDRGTKMWLTVMNPLAKHLADRQN